MRSIGRAGVGRVNGRVPALRPFPSIPTLTACAVFPSP